MHNTPITPGRALIPLTCSLRNGEEQHTGFLSLARPQDYGATHQHHHQHFNEARKQQQHHKAQHTRTNSGPACRRPGSRNSSMNRHSAFILRFFPFWNFKAELCAPLCLSLHEHCHKSPHLHCISGREVQVRKFSIGFSPPFIANQLRPKSGPL